MTTMKLVRPTSESEKHTRTTVDTIEITPKLIASWKVPPFQRAFKANAKVQAVVEQIKIDGGVLPGIITLGVYGGDVYIVDGQHRIRAFEMTGLEVGYVDVRQHYFNDLGEMSEEFVRLNSSLVRLRPDDILRGLEASTPALQRIRKRCSWVAYDQIRRNEKGPVLSMSTFLRTWCGSRGETPSVTFGALAAVALMTEGETDNAVAFITVCYEAWQRDAEFVRLYSGLNLVLCAWLYRRLVLGEGTHANTRFTRYTREDWRRGMAALAADANYLEFLVGRNVGERDRSPAYNRIRTLLGRRYVSDHGKKALYPQSAWNAHS